MQPVVVVFWQVKHTAFLRECAGRAPQCQEGNDYDCLFFHTLKNAKKRILFYPGVNSSYAKGKRFRADLFKPGFSHYHLKIPATGESVHRVGQVGISGIVPGKYLTEQWRDVIKIKTV